MRVIALVATAVILLSNQGDAQTRHNLLRGLSGLDLVIEALSSRAKSCGLTEEAIRAAAMYPLSSTKITLDSLAEVVLHINIGTLHQTVGCISNVYIQVVAFQRVTLQFSGDAKLVDIILWKSASLLTSNQNNHARQVSETIEEEVKRLITDWNLDNKP